MNPVERTLRKADQAQQRHTGPAFVVGVARKFGDDNGGVLVSSMTHAAFVSLFPLLLVLVTILGLVAAGSPSFRQAAVNSVAGQVPLIGHELTSNADQLRRSSVIGLIAGLAGLLFGATTLARAGLFTMAQVWNLPGPQRPGYLPRLGRSAAFLGLLGAGVLVTTLLAGLSAYGSRPPSLVAFALAVQGTVNTGMYAVGFRVLTPRCVRARDLVPGAVMAGILWTALQAGGVYLVHHFLHSDSVYGMFGAVLGLLAWVYLAVQITVCCAEINVVLARRLWPRTVIQPPLTEADRASMAMQALENQRREEQQVTVTFPKPRGETPLPPRTQHTFRVPKPRRPSE